MSGAASCCTIRQTRELRKKSLSKAVLFRARQAYRVYITNSVSSGAAPLLPRYISHTIVFSLGPYGGKACRGQINLPVDPTTPDCSFRPSDRPAADLGVRYPLTLLLRHFALKEREEGMSSRGGGTGAKQPCSPTERPSSSKARRSQSLLLLLLVCLYSSPLICTPSARAHPTPAAGSAGRGRGIFLRSCWLAGPPSPSPSPSGQHDSFPPSGLLFPFRSFAAVKPCVTATAVHSLPPHTQNHPSPPPLLSFGVKPAEEVAAAAAAAAPAAGKKVWMGREREEGRVRKIHA